MKTIVVYYSRSGATKKAAEDLASELGADLAEIRENQPRKGFFGFMRSGFEAATRRLVPIRPLERDPDLYDRVIVATPVWAGHLSSPVRSFLVERGPKIKDFGILVCRSDKKNPYVSVMEDAEAIVGRKRTFERSVQAPVRVR